MIEQDVTARFWDKVRKGYGCWEWAGTKLANGYGCFKHAGRMYKAHRFALMLTNGDLPAGMCVCHSCDNRLCVNPGHLFVGTNDENMADMVSKGRAARGEASAQAKLSEEEVIDIRTLRAFGARQSALARAFGVSQQLVSAICLRGLWGHV